MCSISSSCKAPALKGAATTRRATRMSDLLDRRLLAERDAGVGAPDAVELNDLAPPLLLDRWASPWRRFSRGLRSPARRRAKRRSACRVSGSIRAMPRPTSSRRASTTVRRSVSPFSGASLDIEHLRCAVIDRSLLAAHRQIFDLDAPGQKLRDLVQSADEKDAVLVVAKRRVDLPGDESIARLEQRGGLRLRALG